MLKSGTRIELHGTPAFPGFPGVVAEQALIARAGKRRQSLPAGYHVVKFKDGGMLCVHESRFRVIDNRM